VRGIAVIGTGPETATALVAAAGCAAAERPWARLVAGTGSGAQTAAAALARAAGAPPEEVAPDLFAAEATPLVAARHAGAQLDPEALTREARAAGEEGRFVVVAAGGGVLAPLTPRFSVRDLAAGLGLAVVLAVPAGPRATAEALLALEGIRGAGLVPAAVVLTGWPDPPSRVQLDERALLAELAGVPVETLAPDGPAAKPWPVAEWAEAAPVAPAAAPPAQAVSARVTLEPYRAWEEEPTGDPRATPRPEIMRVLHAIVAAEGPMRASRAYGLYNKASGGKKLTSIARAPLSSALNWLAQERRIVLVRQAEIPWQEDDLVRLPDAPAVRVRELGPRTLEEVPLDEVAELARRLRAAGVAEGGEALKRAVLTAYGLRRLTTRADGYLETALGL
jgi:dethiobiotin synthetase